MEAVVVHPFAGERRIQLFVARIRFAAPDKLRLQL